MKTHVKALVVGGGAVGTGIAYHLAKYGWKDVMLLERDELTSGSTWHAAGLLPLFNMGYATTHLHDYSVEFYKSLEAETGLNAGFSVVGNLRMAQTKERMDEYMLYGSTAETLGIEYQKLTPNQIKERWPLIRTDDLAGAIYHPTDGYINPADVTMAMAKGARQMGVSIERKWQVDGYQWNGDEWKVTCTKMIEKGGNLIPSDEQIIITAEHVVTATGNHAQRTAKLLGIKIPAIPVEHQFIVTDVDPMLQKWRADGNPEHPVIRDADAQSYVREERGGWILGVYEKNAPARFEYGVPDSFRADLFPLNLERIEDQYMAMIHRMPSCEESGLKDDFNGPICYTPDGNPLVGPAPGLRNMWLAEGFSFGITAAGGVGNYMAQMMVNGEAEIDMASLDPKRYGSWMTTEYAARKNEECYEHVYILHHPDEERPACAALRTSPAYAILTKTIIDDMNNGKQTTGESHYNRAYDYIFICFFLGNDFMPHFPAVNIRTGGVDKMINAYKATIGGTNENLTDGKMIFWKNVRKMVSFLADQEENMLKAEVKTRDRREKQYYPMDTPEQKYIKFDAIPTHDRELEKYINPYRDHWQKRYYETLLKIDYDEGRIKQVCMNYMQGLEWTMKYYTSGCADWRWCYQHNYPPLLTDLIKFMPYFDTEFVKLQPEMPVTPLVQLCYVLPRNSLHLLPTKLYNHLKKNYEHLYPTNSDFVWAFCRYFWESHVELPEIEIEDLEKITESVMKEESVFTN